MWHDGLRALQAVPGSSLILRKRPGCTFAIHSHWRGGFFDGDGSIMYSKRNGHIILPQMSISASISAESKRSLDCFHLVYGGRVSEWHNTKSSNCRPMYQWQLSGFTVFPALEDLCGSGLCIKRPQANMLLQRRDLFPGIVGRQLADSVRQARVQLQGELRALRAGSRDNTTAQMYITQLRSLCSSDDEVSAYAAGFCDADGSFGCHQRGNGFYYSVSLSQKNRSFLEAFKEVVLRSKGANVYTNSTRGDSLLQIHRQDDVFQFCANIRPFAVVKRPQVDIIMTMRAGPVARSLLQSMHGNQGLHRRNLT